MCFFPLTKCEHSDPSVKWLIVWEYAIHNPLSSTGWCYGGAVGVKSGSSSLARVHLSWWSCWYWSVTLTPAPFCAHTQPSPDVPLLNSHDCQTWRKPGGVCGEVVSASLERMKIWGAAPACLSGCSNCVKPFFAQGWSCRHGCPLRWTVTRSRSGTRRRSRARGCAAAPARKLTRSSRRKKRTRNTAKPLRITSTTKSLR